MSKRVELELVDGGSCFVKPCDVVVVEPIPFPDGYPERVGITVTGAASDGPVRRLYVLGTVAEVRRRLGWDAEPSGTLTLVPIPEPELWHEAEPVRITNTSELRVGDVTECQGNEFEVFGVHKGKVVYVSNGRTSWDRTPHELAVPHTLLSRLDANGVSQPVTGERRRKTWKELYADGARYWQDAAHQSPEPIKGLSHSENIFTEDCTIYRLVRN